jgi:hypothetical protein
MSATAAETAEETPVIQPPQTGEQVSASRPGCYFDAAENTGDDASALTEVNPDADAAANAEGLAASSLAASTATEADGEPAAKPSVSGDSASSTPSKEPVSQHG